MYGYDQLNRQTSETWYPNAADAVVADSTPPRIRLRLRPRAAESTVSGGTPTPGSDNSYTYDSFGNKITDQQQIAGLMPPGDAHRSIRRRRQPHVSFRPRSAARHDFVNSYSYDYLNRETQVTQAASTASGTDDPVDGKLVNFTYNADGELPRSTAAGRPGPGRHRAPMATTISAG